MTRHTRRLLSSLLMAAAAANLASACTAQEKAGVSDTAAVPGKVSDLPAFERFIAQKPTPAEFKQRYPDVQLVLPGDIATKELRMDNSRYFAEIDGEGRIVGGRFS